MRVSAKKVQLLGRASVREVYKQVFQILKQDPTITVLFLFLALLDLAALLGLFMAHSEPFSFLLAPLIRTFYSDRFLHYPTNFVLLPKLFNHAHLVITTVVGVVITGLTVKKIEGSARGSAHVTLLEASRAVMKRYFAILGAWLLSYVVFRLVFAFAMPLFTSHIAVYMVATFLISVAVQSLMAFFMPAILISDLGFLRGIQEAVRFALKNFLNAVLLITAPMLLIALFSLLKIFSPFFLRVYPELVLWMLIVGIGIMTFVDLMITSSATIFYLKAR